VLSRVQLARQGSLVGSTCKDSVYCPRSTITAPPILGVPKCTDRSISRVDAGEVDFSNKLDKGWLVRVLITAVHLEAVDSVLVDALRKIKISFRTSTEKIGLYIRVGGLGSCRSSSTSTDRRLQPVRRNMLLRQHSASAASSEHACNI
jgi:hypothetical protein